MAQTSNDIVGSCELCGRSPARPVVIRRHRGLILLMQMFQIKPTLCRDHAKQLL